jgi:hypothetical protein
MNRIRTLTALLIVACGGVGSLSAAAPTPAPAPAAKPAVDPAVAYKGWADTKSGRLIDGLKLADAEKAAAAKAIVSDYAITMRVWHEKHKPELDKLWSEWNAARAVVPKDEYPGEVIAHRIDALYDSLKPDYQAFIKKLAGPLTEEQVDAFKESWSRSPGMKRTYNAYLEMAPDLKDDQKKVIQDWMFKAREAAMLTDADREIDNIFKVHKVKVEAYIGTLEWQRLRTVWANKGKAAATAPAPKP